MPNQIPEYVELANQMEMSPENYVRMDEGTYHQETDMFCCTDCYIKQGLPLNTQLIVAYRLFSHKIIPLRR